MDTKKILFITQEIYPYISKNEDAKIQRQLLQSMQKAGGEIRTFMPKWGSINERRNQLHEVIRLSGMNIIVDDSDHTLIIKVASIQQLRIQIYFIDNEDYFQKRLMGYNKEKVAYADNAERAAFYARGVLEIVQKLKWTPDLIHCHGWMSSFVPLYLKRAYHESQSFMKSKIVFSAYNDMLQDQEISEFRNTLKYHEIDDNLLDAEELDFKGADSMYKLALNYSDGFACGGDNVPQEIIDYAKSKNIPSLGFQETDNCSDAYSAFYDEVTGSKK